MIEDWRASVKAAAVADGFGTWLNIPSKVRQVGAVRAVRRSGARTTSSAACC